MTKVLLIADDLTGALDSGIKFAQKGLQALALPDASGFTAEAALPTETQVLIVNSDSRRMPPSEAYAVVRRIAAEALRQGTDVIYKKVDSALRGNVGSELAALVDASGGKSVYFAPAYPAMDRTTRGGVHYISGIPLAESVFSRDPFDPAVHSHIPTLLATQTTLPVTVHEAGGDPGDQPGQIHLFDGQTDVDLQNTAILLRRRGTFRLLAGCAGFAEQVADLLAPDQAPAASIPQFPRAFVVCGSVNPITLGQIAHTRRRGAVNLHLNGEQRRSPEYWLGDAGRQTLQQMLYMSAETPVLIDTQTPDEAANGDRMTVARSMGILAQQLIRLSPDALFLITGGDTLLATIHQMPGALLEPVCQVVEGAVLLKLWQGGRFTYVISKSGGFCPEDTMTHIFEQFVSPTGQAAQFPTLN